MMPQGMDHSPRPIIVDPHMNHMTSQKMNHLSGLPYFSPPSNQNYPGNVEQHYQVPQRVTKIDSLIIFTFLRCQWLPLNQPRKEL
jgi:hypothetical protein